MRKMQKEMLKKGGAFDMFAGDDNRMNIEEAHKMDTAFRKGA